MIYLKKIKVVQNRLEGLIILFIVLFLSACNKGECIGVSYTLREAWNMTQKDSIMVGDTIFFNSSFSSNPFDYNSNSKIEFGGTGILGTSFSIRQIKGYNNLVPAIDSFTFIPMKGRLEANTISPLQIKDLFWTKSADSFQIKFGIIARKKGDYVFNVPDGLGRIDNSNTCENSVYISLRNSNIKNNSYLTYVYYGLNYQPVLDSIHNFSIRVK